MAKTAVDKKDEMVEMWEAWATKNQVAFPKRFNMYEFLNKKRKESKKKKKK